MNKKLLFALFGIAANITLAAGPETTPAGTPTGKDRPDRGYWFYDKPEKPVEPKVKKPKVVIVAPAAKLEEDRKRCEDMATWTPDCGFVNPGTSFQFQAKQRDALIEQMAMSPENPKTVEAFQRYNKWVITRGMEVAQMWQWNLAQNPDLDPSVQSPISQFGVSLMLDAKSNANSEIFKVLKDAGAYLVYFTKSDCRFCHDMNRSIRTVADEMNLPLYNAPLDDQCLSGYTGDYCLSQQVIHEPAQVLQVATVPAVFLYVPDQNWFRIATGVTDERSMSSRIVNFFSAYRNATLKGMSGVDGRPPVNFSASAENPALATGVAPGVYTPPTEEQIRAAVHGGYIKE